MTIEGVDFKEYMPDLLKKANRSFGYLKSFSDFLSHAHRIYLVKSFVLSHLEYGLPLFTAWLKRNKRDHKCKEIQKNLKDMYESCRKWATACSGPKDLMQHMSNIAAFKTIVEERSASIQEQFAHLPEKHPLSLLHKNIQKIKWKKSQLESLLMIQLTKSSMYP